MGVVVDRQAYLKHKDSGLELFYHDCLLRTPELARRLKNAEQRRRSAPSATGRTSTTGSAGTAISPSVTRPASSTRSSRPVCTCRCSAATWPRCR
ncbi:hypothetical protein ACFQ3Z_01095 [Streptomyces nogalater]